MSRYRGSVCRLCRREGEKLFLKGDRCYTDKCGIDRRAYAPGQHGNARRSKQSNFAVQLREKQKIRRLYGVQEKQFRNYFHKADQAKGVTGSNLLVFLERRLDNVAYRLGYASSRAEGRQMVRHGHILVNGKRVNIPSYLVKSGDTVEVKEKSRQMDRVMRSLQAADRRGVPGWLNLDPAACKGDVKVLPTRDDVETPLQENLVVELYSR